MVRAKRRQAALVYCMRMVRVNVTIPDELVRQARDAGLGISAAAAAGLRAELDRLSRLRALDDLVTDLVAEHGPIDPERQAAADAWLDEALDAVQAPAHRPA